MLKILVLVTLLFLGCSEDKTFKNIEDKTLVGKINSFSLMATDDTLLNLSKKAVKEEDIKISNSPYTIMIESSKYPQHCNNPLTPAYEASYDGYVKISVKKAFKTIYFIQRDFHGDVTEEIIKDLLSILKDDLKVN